VAQHSRSACEECYGVAGNSVRKLPIGL